MAPSHHVSPTVLLIDNYDSFTYNLHHYLGQLGAHCIIHRNNTLTVREALDIKADALVISPGPSDPDHAGICLDLIEAAAGTLPIFGVCLGHQSIGQVFGGTIKRAREIVHGKVHAIHHAGGGVFAGLPSPMPATRYHSLIVDRDTLPDCLTPTAWVQETDGSQGAIMGLSHMDMAVHGVQFHPESIETPQGHALLRNFLVSSGLPAAPLDDLVGPRRVA